MLLRLIRNTIKEHNLLCKGDSVLIGLSGGADSVCLTHALHSLSDELGIKLYTAHVNHGIRGEEAERDEAFAHHFSETLGIECFVKHVDVPQLAIEKGQSEETVGRNVRYDFFDKLCGEYNINKIATAHNKNDNAETILMNFMRGSSLSGLCGIPYKRNNIIRPILDCARKDIEKYCQNNHLEYMTDSTNLENNYTRNKIRHTLIPIIEKNFNPNFISTVTQNSDIIREYNNFIDNYTDDIYMETVNNNCIDISKLNKYDTAIRRDIVRRYLINIYGTANDIASIYIRDVLLLTEKHSGTSINLPNNIVIKNEYGKITAEKRMSILTEFSYEIKIGEVLAVNEISKNVIITAVEKRENDGAVYLGMDMADKIIIRNRRIGDRFYPSGMNGSKKLKQYFIDKKIPQNQRNRIPIIEINGRIAAVGERVDRNFLFKDHGVKIEFLNI